MRRFFGVGREEITLFYQDVFEVFFPAGFLDGIEYRSLYRTKVLCFIVMG